MRNRFLVICGTVSIVCIGLTACSHSPYQTDFTNVFGPQFYIGKCDSARATCNENGTCTLVDGDGNTREGNVGELKIAGESKGLACSTSRMFIFDHFKTD